MAVCLSLSVSCINAPLLARHVIGFPYASGRTFRQSCDSGATRGATLAPLASGVASNHYGRPSPISLQFHVLTQSKMNPSVYLNGSDEFHAPEPGATTPNSESALADNLRQDCSEYYLAANAEAEAKAAEATAAAQAHLKALSALRVVLCCCCCCEYNFCPTELRRKKVIVRTLACSLLSPSPFYSIGRAHRPRPMRRRRRRRLPTRRR